MVAGPDHADAGRGRMAIAVLQVGGDRIGEALAGVAVGRLRVGDRRSAGETRGEAVVPAVEVLSRAQQLAPRGLALTARDTAPVPQLKDGIGGKPNAGDACTSAVTSASCTFLAPRSVR